MILVIAVITFLAVLLAVRIKKDEEMRHRVVKTFLLVLVAYGLVGLTGGCETSRKLNTSYVPENSIVPSSGLASYLELSDPTLCEADYTGDLSAISPETAIDYNNVEYRTITLEQCIANALQSSEVFRDLGGAIVNQTSTVATSLDPALQFTNPLAGEAAALSAFDANLNSSLFFEDIQRPFNNLFSGDQGLLDQDLIASQFEVSKISATGTEFTSRTSFNYDANNQTGNRFGSSWEAILDAGFRHPLLQGSGSLFNRIAGPSGIPGQYNGILIARTNTEISLADFEDSVREFVSNVENAYWDLYFAYRELEAQTSARDAALDVAKKTRVLEQEEKIGKLELASAEEQLLRFEIALIESLEGRLLDGTQANSGSSGGSFNRSIGVRTAERRLRYLLGMAITDGTLLKPVDQPIKVALAFDWHQSVGTAISKRPEIRRQKWTIKQRELELTAARNFLLPRVDIVGNYRARGLGKQLVGTGATLADDIASGADSANAESNAVSDLFSGDFQEVQFGAEFALPVGFRQANAGVRNAELSVQRERIVLKEQERKIMLDLSNSIAECRRAFNTMAAAERRFNAATEYRGQAEERLKTGRVQYDVLLEAQRRILEAQLQFINSEVEYAIAIKNVHFEKATFLNYHGIWLSESQSDGKANSDYRRRISRLSKPMNYVMQDPPIGVTKGAGLQSGGCSQCGTDSGQCSCGTTAAHASSGCSTCGHAICSCHQAAATTLSAPPVPITINEAMEDEQPEEKDDLPARGLGKKHVYQPQFLPRSTPQ